MAEARTPGSVSSMASQDHSPANPPRSARSTRPEVHVEILSMGFHKSRLQRLRGTPQDTCFTDWSQKPTHCRENYPGGNNQLTERQKVHKETPKHHPSSL